MKCETLYFSIHTKISTANVHAPRWDRPVRRLLPQIIQLEIAIVQRCVASRRSESSWTVLKIHDYCLQVHLFSTVAIALLQCDASPGACVIVARRPRVAICHSRPQAGVPSAQASKRAKRRARSTRSACMRAHANARVPVDERCTPCSGAEASHECSAFNGDQQQWYATMTRVAAASLLAFE